ncbi:MAG: hypothetical protein JNL97_06715, partial [Verrucomicrobiales bacterium]|nr:hypothetical protein [Verrucomicrobiales bacterium]
IRTAETRVVAGSDPIRLPAGSGKRIEIDYLALGFAAPEKIRFRYRLVGNDERWTDADARRIAYFTNLRPGAYRFEVLARNRDGVWCAEPAVARFAIRPGWHESRLVAAASGFLVLVAIVALHRMRLRATRAKERQTIARALHDQLAGKLAALVKAAEAVPDDPPTHDEKTLESPTRAGAVVELARSALATLRRTIALGLPASGRLPALVHAIVQHAEETCIPLRLSLRLDVPIEVPDRVVPYRVREEVLLVASEAINNVIKHAEAARVVVRMRFDDALLRLEIEDDGRGIPDALERESEGGLRHMRERAVQIGARFTLTPSDGGGTLVRLVVPRP